MTTILVIEDEANIRHNIADVLQFEAYDVILAEDGLQGTQFAFEYLPDLIICDVMMPGRDGFAVIQELQTVPETAMIPFIFLTALVDRQSMRQGMTLGADDYVVKPFDGGELLDTVRTRLAKHATALERYRRILADEARTTVDLPNQGAERLPQNLTGSTLRGYQIGEKIGEGGAGTIYKAYQGNLGREVAIKILRQSARKNVEFVRRFQTEAELIARLEHPHIIPLYDYWYDDNNIYLVMRFLRGGSLRDILLQEGRRSLQEMADILDQVAGALALAHQVGIVHRDLKPDNIVLDERENAYLTDFGLAKNVFSGAMDERVSVDLEALLQAQDEFFADKPNSTLYITDMDTMTGTPAYLSPEQVRSEALTPQSDIYSLGITLYETLTGQQPFSGTLPEIIGQQLNEELPAIHPQFGDVPLAVDEVLRRATAKNWQERYPDAVMLAREFRQACCLKDQA